MPPELRPALPPAIRTDEMQRLEQRGWCRCSTTELMADLELACAASWSWFN